jgi:dTDP-4-amino-4,6-dideoxygalactose transaminase
VPDGRESVWAQYTLTAATPELRGAAIKKLTDRGVPTAVYYPRPLHLQSAYNKYPISPSGLKISEKLSKTVFSIPMHPYLDMASQEKIIKLLNSI